MSILNLPSGAVMDINDIFYSFIKDEVLNNVEMSPEEFFHILANLVEIFGDKNRELLDKRSYYQTKIDEYYIEKRANGWVPSDQSSDRDSEELERFLVEIGYLSTKTNDLSQCSTPTLDYEMNQNGPELVTPVTNASMAVGGVNARWGSLYDAIYLSDIEPGIDKQSNRSERLKMVVGFTNSFLDDFISNWSDEVGFGEIESYFIRMNEDNRYELVGVTKSKREVLLNNSNKFIGFNRYNNGDLSEIYLEDNGLRLILQLYEGSKVSEENGQFKDFIVESAITNIIDFEDAVAIVDVQDMVDGLRNFLGLIKGDLIGYGSSGNLKSINSDKEYIDINDKPKFLKGTSLMSVRNVSLHIYTDIITINGREIPERILGVLTTTLIAVLHDKGSKPEEKDLNSIDGLMPSRGPNSSKGYVYQVTPKLQTPEEVFEQIRLFEAIENHLGLSQPTILIGIMNEELGMTLELSQSIQAAEGRIFFTNTGFLDRTGSQIRVQMYSGPVDARDELTGKPFNINYELHNVQISIQSGINKNGKIGKGMQVKNRAMTEMLEKKIEHLKTGGNTAWVPAPYPSHIHSMHYHMIDVDEIQRYMEDHPSAPVKTPELLNFPVMRQEHMLSNGVIKQLLFRYVHSMVAYVVPWIHKGIGCSGVRNFDNVEEMKDRATERIDGAIIANWRLHGVVSDRDIEQAVSEAVKYVNKANSNDANYMPVPDINGDFPTQSKLPAIAAVMEIIDDSLTSTSAYVEPALYKNRRVFKSLT